MFDESTRFKQVCQLLLSLIVAYDANCFLDIPQVGEGWVRRVTQVHTGYKFWIDPRLYNK